MNFNISKSMLNAFNEYRSRKLCGLLFDAVYIKKSVSLPTSESAELGKWFEFICTGYCGKDEIKPVPPTLKNGSLPAEYNRMLLTQKQNFDEIYKDFKVESFGLTVEHEWLDSGELYNLKGILDVLCENHVIRDIKTTGLIDNKWEDFGWGGDITKKESLMMQPLLYGFIYWKRYGVIPDFYFDIFSTGTKSEVRTIQIVVTEFDLQQFEIKLSEMCNQLKFHLDVGFEAYPNLKNCGNCPLKNECEMVSLKPEIERFTFYSE